MNNWHLLFALFGVLTLVTMLYVFVTDGQLRRTYDESGQRIKRKFGFKEIAGVLYPVFGLLAVIFFIIGFIAN